MKGFLTQFRLSLVLHFRNRMALIYGYVFPVMFLVAVWVLYRHERVPIARHLGELLTIGVLGGACFGLPTTLVSERERGVWRRYRLAPSSTAAIVGSTMTARYVLLLSAGLLQILLAMAIGMPAPAHLFGMVIAFTCVAFAFLGLGLLIAAMADTVPAVQALGQSIFLPMLIIGGVAVPLASLPVWAQHVSAFFPGRYAVEALQASAIGGGIADAPFALMALLAIGLAGMIGGGRLFRWDAGERFAARPGKGWVAVAIAGWAAVGLVAESRGRVRIAAPAADAAAVPAAPIPPPPTESRSDVPVAPARTPEPSLPPAVTPPARTAAPVVEPWRALTRAQIDAQIEKQVDFSRLPPDDGVVTPIAPPDEEPEAEIVDELERIRLRLPTWKPGQVRDPVQRVRNYLFVAIVPDIYQMPIERFVPHLVFSHLQATTAEDDLVKIVYWIARHPAEGDDAALDELHAFGLGNGPSDANEVHDRTQIYALKLLGRLVGRIRN
jgi:ABC-2 type transport system permease protein